MKSGSHRHDRQKLWERGGGIGGMWGGRRSFLFPKSFPAELLFVQAHEKLPL